jgi:hypothetical protein
MDKITKLHLESITTDVLLSWKSDLFVTFASCYKNGNRYELGLTGKGKFAVKIGDIITKYRTVSDAVIGYHIALRS